MKTKICSKCGIEKDLEEFHKDRTKKDGLRNQCKKCRKEYYEANKEYWKEYDKKKVEGNRKNNTEEKYNLWVIFGKKKKCIKCKIEKDLEEFSKDRTKKDGFCGKCKACMKKHSKNWRKENKEYSKKHSKNWRKENPEKCREYNRKRRALRTNAEGNFTEKEFKKILNFYHYKCCACGKNLRKEIIHRDHIQPLSKGGSNYIKNIQPLCEHCNLTKNADWIDYRDVWLQNYAI